MSTAYLAVAVLLLAPSLEAQGTQSTLAPSYSTASIANAATNLPGGFAPNSILTIYGANLSYNTAGATQTNMLPKTLGGVTVYFGSVQGFLFYVSPTQINVLVPYNLRAGATSVTVIREGTAGPTIPITLTSTAPGFFQFTQNTLLATHADSSLITAAAPAVGGEVIVIYATGLGLTVPDQIDGTIPTRAAPIAGLANLSMLINGVALDSRAIQYAGVTPGCAGLYQINVILPAPLPSNPEIRAAIGDQMSPPSTTLPVQ